MDSSDGNVFLGILAITCHKFLKSVFSCWRGFQMTAHHCFPCVKRFMSGVTCRYLFIFSPHLSVADNLFPVAPFMFQKLWRDVCGWDQTAAAHMHHSFLAGNERWREHVNIYVSRSARQRLTIYFNGGCFFSQSRTSSLWLWQSGCDKRLVSATEVINEGLVRSVAVAALTKRLVA